MKKYVVTIILICVLIGAMICVLAIIRFGQKKASPETPSAEAVSEPTTPPGPKMIQIGPKAFQEDAKKINLSDIDIKAEGIDMEETIAFFPNLKKIKMLNCGLTNDEYAALQDAHPEIKIVWTIDLEHWKIRTDSVAFSTYKDTSQMFFMSNEDAYYLKYCTDLVALDLGHNCVTDLSFLEFMPKLKILILVDNAYDRSEAHIRYLDDLSMLKHCPKLRYLEIFAIHVSDLSFLKKCKEIEDLNVSYTNVYSTEYLTNLPNLKRLWIEKCGLTYDDYAYLTSLYPDAKIVFKGEGSVDQGWREGERYNAMRWMFEHNKVHKIYRD